MSRTIKIYNKRGPLFIHKWWKERNVCIGPHNECRRCHRNRHNREFHGYAWARKRDLINHRIMD